ncbi:MAG: substrate-binding domain-containing protein [Betaproteobacteria bacterium]
MGLRASRADILRRVIAVVAATFFYAPLTVGAAELRIGGTGNALGTMRLLAEAYAQSHPESKPLILSSIGTSGAIKSVAKGALEIGLSSRALTEEETGSGLTAIEYARSPTVFAVQEKSKFSSLSLQQITDIYSGKLTQWPDGTVIRLVLRQPGDDNTRQIMQLSPEMANAVNIASQRPGMIFGFNDQEAADKMENLSGSLGVTTIALIRSEKRRLKAVALEGVEPSLENMRSGRYSLIKHFNFVLPKNPSPAVQDFIGFVKSPQGRKILENIGHTVP